MSRGPYNTAVSWDAAPVGLLRKLRRINAGLTQPQLAELARVSVRTVRNWERGRSSMNIDAVLRRREIELEERDRAAQDLQVAGLARSSETGNAGASTRSSPDDR
jgi:transcriptional regulator with XRE-family HTH domain